MLIAVSYLVAPPKRTTRLRETTLRISFSADCDTALVPPMMTAVLADSRWIPLWLPLRAYSSPLAQSAIATLPPMTMQLARQESSPRSNNDVLATVGKRLLRDATHRTVSGDPCKSFIVGLSTLSFNRQQAQHTDNRTAQREESHHVILNLNHLHPPRFIRTSIGLRASVESRYFTYSSSVGSQTISANCLVHP